MPSSHLILWPPLLLLPPVPPSIRVFSNESTLRTQRASGVLLWVGGRLAEEGWLCPRVGLLGLQAQIARDTGCSRLRAELLPSVAAECRALILGFCRIPWGVTQKAKGLCWHRDAPSIGRQLHVPTLRH